MEIQMLKDEDDEFEIPEITNEMIKNSRPIQYYFDKWDINPTELAQVNLENINLNNISNEEFGKIIDNCFI